MDVQQLPAEIQAAHRPHLNIQECQRDPVCLCKAYRLRRFGEAGDHRPGHAPLQDRKAALEYDSLIIHQNDVRVLLTFCRKVKQGVGVHAESVRKPVQHILRSGIGRSGFVSEDRARGNSSFLRKGILR